MNCLQRSTEITQMGESNLWWPVQGFCLARDDRNSYLYFQETVIVNHACGRAEDTLPGMVEANFQFLLKLHNCRHNGVREGLQHAASGADVFGTFRVRIRGFIRRLLPLEAPGSPSCAWG